MNRTIRIGTRESELAVWQANAVKNLLHQQNIVSELVFVKSEGDIDLVTPLYEMGVQGIFTKALDVSLLNSTIDIAVHSMKDVPTILPHGIVKAAVLERSSYKDLLVYKNEDVVEKWKINENVPEPLLIAGIIATSSIRRKAQWHRRYPQHEIVNLRGNVNTRLQKVDNNNWDGAIFAAAGLERINLRPANSVELDWMVPAPAQGAIMIVCREKDSYCLEVCKTLNHKETEICTSIERDFLHELKGGCSTPVGALALINNEELYFKANICTVNGKEIIEIDSKISMDKNPEDIASLGIHSAQNLLKDPKAIDIMRRIRNE